MVRVRNNVRKKIFAGCLAALMMISMVGCGNGNAKTTGSEAGTGSNGTSSASSVSAASVDDKECAFSENEDFGIDSSINVEKAIKLGEDIALLSYDDSTGGSVYFKSMTGDEEKLIYSSPEESSVDNITEADGNIAVIESKELKRTLRIIDKDGNEISSVNLSGLDDLSFDNSRSSYMVTKDGEVAVADVQELILLNKDGSENRRVEFSSVLMCGCLTKNGDIVVFGEAGSDDTEATVVDPKTGETVTKILLNSQYLKDGAVQTGFGDYDFYVKKDSGIYGYKLDEKTEYKICDFNTSVIDGTNVNSCLVLDAETLLCLEYESTAQSFNLRSYDKVDPSEVDEVETLTVAITVPSQELQQDVTDFNRNHSDVRISLIDYSLEEDPIAKFSADIAAGNIADMYDVSFGYGDITVNEAVQRGLLEDLTPYIENDPDISEDDFLDSIIRAQKIDGKLYYLGTSFYINALLVKKSEIGDRTGWTYEEMMEYVNSKPDDTFPFKDKGKQEILSGFLYGSMSEFVDWEKGECYFDSEAFKSLLEYSSRGTDDGMTEWDPDLPFVDDLQSGKQLFYNGEIEPTIWPLYEKFFDGDIAWIGYPDENREGYYAQVYGGTAISSACSDKDTAWEFVKFCVSKEQEGKSYVDNVGMPTRKDVFEIYMQGKTSETGFIDEFGNSVGPGDGIFGLGSVTVELRALTPEEEQKFRDLVDQVSNVYAEDTKMMDIITDECKLYYTGDKSLDETVKIIQNRAETYMNESK